MRARGRGMETGAGERASHGHESQEKRGLPKNGGGAAVSTTAERMVLGDTKIVRHAWQIRGYRGGGAISLKR